MRLDATFASPNPRFVIAHYHIFKNGGSTIESILEREFPRAFATLHGDGTSAILDGRHLKLFLRRHPRISAVSSHHLRYPKPSIRDVVVFDCCFLRHPLDRLESLYSYLRSIISVDPLSVRAHRLNARDFLRELVDESPHLVSNVQVTQLACSGAFIRPAHPDDLERAAAIFCGMAMPGLVEMFDESLVAAEYFIRPAFPSLRLEYVPHNVSRAPAARGLSQTPDPRECWSDLWGARLYEDLVRLNRLDLELFGRAEVEIRRRVGLLPEAARRLKDFRTRCSRLRAERDGAEPPVRQPVQRVSS